MTRPWRLLLTARAPHLRWFLAYCRPTGGATYAVRYCRHSELCTKTLSSRPKSVRSEPISQAHLIIQDKAHILRKLTVPPWFLEWQRSSHSCLISSSFLSRLLQSFSSHSTIYIGSKWYPLLRMTKSNPSLHLSWQNSLSYLPSRRVQSNQTLKIN